MKDSVVVQECKVEIEQIEIEITRTRLHEGLLLVIKEQMMIQYNAVLAFGFKVL